MPGSRAAPLHSLMVLLAVANGCQNVATKPAPAAPVVFTAGALLPSPRLIMGRVLAVDPKQGFAFVELAGEAPKAGLAAGTELISRTLDLRETARLQVSAFQRGRTLGTKIVAGQPSPGDEVVWLAP